MSTYRIAPSILAADFARLGDHVRQVEDAGVELIHFDVMDNHYVPNLTIGPDVLKALIRYGIRTPMDVHLMTTPVDRLCEDFLAAGAAVISVHPETSHHIHRTLQLIRSGGARAGVALNPGTPLSALEWLLDVTDVVLVMSVNPGFGGQKFIHSALPKIRALRALLDASGRDIAIQVDGGINAGNIRAVADAGADTFVAGSAIFGADDPAAAVRGLRAALAG